ncbi:MAG: hypothetical protein RQ966_15325 [Acetobacteraceae bacterium]|nr:hypothetical protein [Acetobacteraceae bacterium]
MFNTVLKLTVVIAALASMPAFANGYTDTSHYSCGLECGKSALPGTTYYATPNGGWSTTPPVNRQAMAHQVIRNETPETRGR